MAFGAIIKSLPRYGLEIFGFTIIISWLLFALSKNITLVEIIQFWVYMQLLDSKLYQQSQEFIWE